MPKVVGASDSSPPIVLVGAGFLGAFPGPGQPEASDGVIHSFALGRDGHFTPLQRQQQSGSFPMAMALHYTGAHTIIYVAETPSPSATGFVNAYRLDPNGQMHHLSRSSSEGAVPCHLAVAGRTLLASNFVGGSIAALPINPDGSLQSASPRSVLQHSPTPLSAGAPRHSCGRQEAAHPHMALPDPDGRFVLVCDLGCNTVSTYELDQSTHQLSWRSELRMHYGAGPRHLALSPVAPFAYCVNEIDNTLTALRYRPADGSLSFADQSPVSLLPEGTAHADEGGAAGIVVSPDGLFAYVTVRASGGFNGSIACPVFNCVSVLSLDLQNGQATLVQTVSSGGSMPWTLAFVAGDDSQLLVQNQHREHSGLPEAEGGENDGHNGVGPGRVVVFNRDRETGLLDQRSSIDVPQAISVMSISSNL